MKNFKGFILLFLIAVISFTACTKEDVTDGSSTVITPDPTETTSNPLVTNRGVAGDNGLYIGCFTINYPFSLDVDGTTTEINSEAEEKYFLSEPT